MKRTLLAAVFAALLLGAYQAAVPPTRPGHENITFWLNHNGLEQIDVLGEVGFSDMARILMRRRANSERFRAIRDTFTFPVQKMEALETPDLFRAEYDGSELRWRSHPERFVAGANLTFNIPVVIHNRSTAPVTVEASFGSTTSSSTAPPVTIAPGDAAGLFLRAVETKAGAAAGSIRLSAAGKELTAGVAFDVRPLARLRVELPEPARVYMTGSDGLAYAPRGLSSRITAMSAEYYFYARGSFEVEMPAGETVIEATRGIEYKLTRKTVTLSPGAVTEVSLPLERWIHMAREGWHSSDAHIHANYTSTHHQVVTPETMQLQILGEDLNYANLMVANSSGAFLHDEQYFEGKPHRLSAPGYLMVWGEEMRNAGSYGHMCFYNLKSLVHPLYTGFRGTPQWEDYPPNYTQAKAARDQGGAVTYAHPTRKAAFESSSATELPVDLALGEVDAMDVLANTDEIASMELWYKLLNCGLKLAISAGTDAFTNVADHYIPGGGRLYAWSGDRLSSDTWITSYKRGRSFASNGPMVTVKVEGQEPGSELRLPAARPIRVEARLRSQVPVETVEFIVNGKVVLTRPADREHYSETLTIDRSAWVAVRVLGPWHRLLVNDKQAFAHTSPVYVSVAGGKPVVREDARFYREWVEKLITRVERNGRFATAEKRGEVVALFRKALEYYRNLEGQ